MKKNILIISSVLVCALTGLFSACEDDLVSTKHQYTEEEQARLDSLKAAQAGVKADYIITHDIDIEHGAWASITVPLDIADMCAQLGYADEAALLAGIGAFNGELKFIAVNHSNVECLDHVVDETGVQEGFVFRTDGSPEPGWNGLYEGFWVVYNTTDKEYIVGESGHGEIDKTYKLITLWQKGNGENAYRLAVIFNVNIIEAVDPNATSYIADEVLTQDMTLVSPDITANATSTVALDGATLAAKLGYANTAALSAALGNAMYGTQVSNEVQFFGVNLTDGTDYKALYTADMGYWYTAGGDVCIYTAEDAAVSVSLDPATLSLVVGQKGGKVEDGASYKAVVMFANQANYRVAVEVNVTTVQDAAPAGMPYEINVTQTVTHKLMDDWSQDFIDVTAVLRDAFKKTNAEIIAAIGNQSLTFYANGDPTQTTTADYPGHWFNPDGSVATVWSDGEICSILFIEGEKLKFKIFNHPNNITDPATVTIRQTAEMNGGRVNFTFVVELVADYAPFTAEFTCNVNHIANDAYSTTNIDVTDVVTAAFQKSVAEVDAAIEEHEVEFTLGGAASTGNYPGHWFDTSGNACGWGGTDVFGDIEMNVVEGRILLLIYNFPGTSGTATANQIAKLGGGQVNFHITVNLVAE
jgi:hypothetical protein